MTDVVLTKARHLHFCKISEANQLEGEERDAEYERVYLNGAADDEILPETFAAAEDWLSKRSPANTHGGRKMLPAVAAGLL